MGSPASLLSPEERLLRRHSDRSTSRDRSESPDRPVPGNMTFGVTPVARAVTGTRPGQANRRISAGAVGVFGIGVGAQDASPPVQRGREVNGHIFQNKESPEVEMERHELWLSAALGVDRTKKVLNFSRPEQKTPVGRGQGVKTPGTPGSDPGTLLWDSVAHRNNGMDFLKWWRFDTDSNYSGRVVAATRKEIPETGCTFDAVQSLGCSGLEG